MTLILLPPSEGKADASEGAPLDLDSLSHPELTRTRERLVSALVSLSGGSQARALRTLGLSPGQVDELARNVRLREAPTAPARQVYSGILFDAIGIATLSPSSLARLDQSVVVHSALFGLIRAADHIPAYRFSAGTTLPRVGTVASAWGSQCASIIADYAGLVVDLRSGNYAALGRLNRGAHAVTPRILQQMAVGPPKAVSHNNKAAKGALVRAMVTERRVPSTPTAVAELAAQQGDVELVETPYGWQLDLVLPPILGNGSESAG